MALLTLPIVPSASSSRKAATIAPLQRSTIETVPVKQQMHMPHKLFDAKMPFAQPVGEFIRQRRAARFRAKVRNALTELGLHVPGFKLALTRLFEEVCAAGYAREGDNANPHALAIEFFLRLTIEYPAVLGNAVMFDGILLKSVDVLRSWHLKSLVSAELAEAAIAQVKHHLLRQLQDLDVSEDVRLETEIQIREL